MSKVGLDDTTRTHKDKERKKETVKERRDEMGSQFTIE